jgi:Flp pilus assembly protein TadG
VTRRLRGERGQSITEFALVAPLVVLLLVGLAQTGIYFYRAELLADAVRSAARAALTCRVNQTVVPGTVGNQSAPSSFGTVSWSIQDLTSGSSGTSSCPSPIGTGDNLKVTGVASSGNIGFPILGSIFPSTISSDLTVVAE